jgi:4-hydroxybenzoyl-CoA thioesterase
MLANSRTVLVEFGDCDPTGIVYNPNYFIWFDRSVHALLAWAGLSLKGLIDDFGIDGIPVVEYRTRFLAPVRWGDTLSIETSVTELHRSAFEIQHRVFNAGVLAVDCSETRVCTALDKNEGRVRARPLPEPLVEALRGAPENAPHPTDS